MAKLVFLLLSTVGLFGGCADVASAQTPDDIIAVVVDGEPIRLRQVKHTLVTALRGKSVPPAIMPMLQAQSLEQTINRRLVLAKLKSLNYEPTADELRQAEENFNTNLQLKALSREAYLQQNGFTEQDLSDLRYWDICWNRYAREHLNDAALEKYFERHRRDFDGTELRLSHVLLRVEGRGEQAEIAGVVAAAQKLREEITGGKIAFADAATQRSSGPSRERGGDLGFIPRHEMMVEEFTAAAFKLKKGEISPPVITPFGVHLITVVDERPGTKPWTEVRDQLYDGAQNELFRELAAELRKTAKVEYSSVMPHLDPATGQIRLPAGAIK